MEPGKEKALPTTKEGLKQIAGKALGKLHRYAEEIPFSACLLITEFIYVIRMRIKNRKYPDVHTTRKE